MFILIFTGVWVVGNIGREQGSPWLTIFFSYLTYLLRWYVYDESIWFSIMVFTSALAFDFFSKQWRRKPHTKKSLYK